MTVAQCFDFENLTPDRLLDAVEAALSVSLTGLAHPLNSYINRVYELAATDGTRLIAKFYRPGRWTREAVEQEHRFVTQCAAEEIPVVAPLALGSSTIGVVDNILFAVYPKRLGRELEPIHPEDWRRLGRVVARLHVVGSREGSSSRVYLHPSDSTAEDIDQLREGEFVTDKYRYEFAEVTEEILAQIVPLFDDCEAIRIHGDCHRGNLLERPGEGILVIDFDDMAEGPPVQDLWMLLPDHLDKARREVNLILEGYEDFREFDDRSLRLIEPLRVMRILYFLAWCSRQCDDPNFHRNFPDWGSDAFWYREIADLRKQQRVIAEHL